MKWTVLSDNRTNQDQLQTEHGLSILLETEKYRILLDTGASDVFIRNAEKIELAMQSDWASISARSTMCLSLTDIATMLEV